MRGKDNAKTQRALRKPERLRAGNALEERQSAESFMLLMQKRQLGLPAAGTLPYWLVG
jgi:hypothetical protein